MVQEKWALAQRASSKIWIRVAQSISKDDNRYATYTCVRKHCKSVYTCINIWKYLSTYVYVCFWFSYWIMPRGENYAL